MAMVFLIDSEILSDRELDFEDEVEFHCASVISPVMTMDEKLMRREGEETRT